MRYSSWLTSSTLSPLYLSAEISPSGFKYIVQVQLVENLGQGGRADLSCHWEDSDAVIQELL